MDNGNKDPSGKQGGKKVVAFVTVMLETENDMGITLSPGLDPLRACGLLTRAANFIANAAPQKKNLIQTPGLVPPDDLMKGKNGG